jgi:hypothetical protein
MTTSHRRCSVDLDAEDGLVEVDACTDGFTVGFLMSIVAAITYLRS